MNLAPGEIFDIQDSYLPYHIYVSSTSGNLILISCTLEVYTDHTGHFYFIASNPMALNFSSNVDTVFYKASSMNGGHYSFNGVVSLIGGQTLDVSWRLPPAPSYSVLVVVNSGLYGQVTPAAGTYNYSTGSRIPITAIAKNGYEFDHWIVNAATNFNTTFNPYNILLTSDTVITPVWSYTNSSGVYYFLGDLFPQKLFRYTSELVYGYSAIIPGAINPQTGSLLYYGSNYQNIHDSTICNISSREVSTPLIVGQWYDYGKFGVYRSIFYFDTKILMKGIEIINVTLYFVPYINQNVTSHPFNIVAQKLSQFDMPFNYTDYNSQLYYGNYGQVVTSKLNGTLDNSPYNILRLNSSIINEGGITEFALRSSEDINSVAPVTSANGNDEMIMINNYATLQPYIKIAYSTDAEILVITNIPNAPVYVNNNFARYTIKTFPDSIPNANLTTYYNNNYTCTIGVIPNNNTIPNYRISFGSITGYITPSAQIVTVGYGNIRVVWAIYRSTSFNNPSIFGMDFAFIGNNIFVPGFLTAVISSGGYMAGRKLNHKWAGALIMGAVGLLAMGWFQIVPIYIIGIIFAVGGFLVYYLWWKNRGSGGGVE